MVKKRKNGFRRKSRNLNPIQSIIVVTEGEKSEPNYLTEIRNLPGGDRSKRMRPIKGNGKSAVQLLDLMKDELSDSPLIYGDEAWIVFDVDSNSSDEIAKLEKWEKTHENYHIVISNPKIEYWFLLHFHNGNGVGTKENCDRLLKKFHPNYEKEFNSKFITPKHVDKAIKHAEQRAKNSNNYDIGIFGWTMMHSLVKSMLK